VTHPKIISDENFGKTNVNFSFKGNANANRAIDDRVLSSFEEHIYRPDDDFITPDTYDDYLKKRFLSGVEIMESDGTTTQARRLSESELSARKLTEVPIFRALSASMGDTLQGGEANNT
jgi:hypothetical protein